MVAFPMDFVLYLDPHSEGLGSIPSNAPVTSHDGLSLGRLSATKVVPCERLCCTSLPLIFVALLEVVRVVGAWCGVWYGVWARLRSRKFNGVVVLQILGSADGVS